MFFRKLWRTPSPKPRSRQHRATKKLTLEHLESRELLAVIGTFQDGTWQIDLNGNRVFDGSTAGDFKATFGKKRDKPVVGDFQGMGHDQIGVYRNGKWLIDANDNKVWDGIAGGDKQFKFGGPSPSAVPVVGDWNGDGIDEIGVFKKGIWQLDWNGNGIWDGVAGGDRRFSFGAKIKDKPVVGDWDGDGIDEIGVYSKGAWKLDLNGNGIWDGTAGGDVSYAFTNTVNRSIIGDWSGTGRDRIGQWNGGKWYVDANGNGQFDNITGGDSIYAFGSGGKVPVVLAGQPRVVGQPPSVNAGTNVTANEAQPVQFSGSVSGAPGDIFTYVWEFGDGSTASGTTTPLHTYADNGSYTVRLTATNQNGQSTSSPLTATILNVAPTATLTNGGPVNEGAMGTVTVTNAADVSSADVAAGFRYFYDFNNDGTFDISNSTSASATVPASYLTDGPSARTVRGRIQDKDGGFRDYTTTITVNNVAPMVQAGGPYVGTIGALITFVALATDPSSADTAAGLTYTWNFGDGSAVVQGANVAHAYAAEGNYTVTVAATDKNGATGTATTTASVTRVAQNVINIDQNWLDQRGAGPYYLDQAGKTYRLQTDVTTDGTAFAIIAANVTFDLNGHTVTYDNAAPITIPNGSFEQGSGGTATGWNFSSAPNTTRHQGTWLHNEVYDGSHSLKFALPASDQHVVSTSTITLEANTTYSLSAMFENGGQGYTGNSGVKGYVRLVSSGLPTREVSWANWNSRGIQLREGVFTTGGTVETYHIQVGIEGGGSLNPATAKSFYIDDIKIQRTNVYGVAAATQGWAATYYPGITRWGVGTNATITNGTLVQGTDGATWGHGVFIQTTAGVTLSGLNITVHGANSSAILGLDQSTFTSTVHSNTLTSNVKTITSRDNFHGAVLHYLQGDIYNNTITNGVHSGIVAAGGTTQQRIASNIYGNTIQLSSKYTNGFAIIAHWGSQIHDNVINAGTGAFAARGILTSGGIGGVTTKIYDNTIHVQQSINNQEYEGAQLGGAYGIQVENGHNVEVYGNDVYAHGNEVPAYAYRMNSDSGTSAAVRVHHNTFRAISNGARAAATMFSAIDNNSLDFVDNTLITNDGITGVSRESMVTLRQSTIVIETPVDNPHPFDAMWTADPSLHCAITLLDTIFANDDSRNYVHDAVARNLEEYGGEITTKMAFELDWTTSIRVRGSDGSPLASAHILIVDRDGNQVANGNSDENGLFVIRLREFRTVGDLKTVFGPYSLTASFGQDEATTQFEADEVQTIDVSL